MGKFLWEGRKKGLPCWLSQFSFAIAKFVWKMQKKSGIMKSGLDAMPLFLLAGNFYLKKPFETPCSFYLLFATLF